VTLSRPQLDALRYANGRQLYAATINNGNGNMRRTLLSLLKIGMLAWDPIYHGRVVVTVAGTQQLQMARDRKLDARTKLGAIGRKLKTIDRLAPAPRWWNGLCPEGKHGLDFEGQRCDLCPASPEEVSP
jgi:hypothetical protein